MQNYNILLSCIPKVLTKNRFVSLFFTLISIFIFDSVSYAQLINAGTDTLICSSNSIKLGGNPVATGSPISFSWTSSASASAFSTDSTPTVSPSSTIDYYLAVTYSSGTLIDTVTISVVKLKADFGLSEDTVCSGTRVLFYDSTKHTSTSVTYAWNFGVTGATSTNKNPKYTFKTTTLGSGSTSR